jgi:hypothetical protein
MMVEFAATGLPPAYVPHDTTVGRDDGDYDSDDDNHPEREENP